MSMNIILYYYYYMIYIAPISRIESEAHIAANQLNILSLWEAACSVHKFSIVHDSTERSVVLASTVNEQQLSG